MDSRPVRTVSPEITGPQSGNIHALQPELFRPCSIVDFMTCSSVRGPFLSKSSEAGIVWGEVRVGEKLEVASQMPQDGVIFSDGVEADYLSFDFVAAASIPVAEEKTGLFSAWSGRLSAVSRRPS
jgi:hypothetical protein